MRIDAMDILLCVEDEWHGFDNEQTLAECFCLSTSEDDEMIAAEQYETPNYWR